MIPFPRSFTLLLVALATRGYSSSIGRHSHLRSLHSSHSGGNLLGGSIGGITDLLSHPSLIDTDTDPEFSVKCEPLESTFSPSDVSSLSPAAPFVAASSSDTYSITDDGLQMFLKRPKGEIVRKGDTNSVQGVGATINSTFFIQNAKVTIEMRAPTIAGSVTAGITIGVDSGDEIDVELLGGYPQQWQTNVYSPSPKDKQPLWGVFGEKHKTGSSSIANFHNYTIDWTTDRIVWSIDGDVVRTVTPDDTKVNGTLHYPSRPSRVQLGIWDASSPEGTSEWARGPIDWDKAPDTIIATVRRVSLECNNTE